MPCIIILSVRVEEVVSELPLGVLVLLLLGSVAMVMLWRTRKGSEHTGQR